jgi:adenosylcobinamide-GDP ribazoletransferase
LHEISTGSLCIALVAGHALSRSFSAAFMSTYDYVGGGAASKSHALCNRMSKPGLAFTALTGVLPLALFREAGVFLCLIPMILIHWTLGSAWKKKIGGYTGDCLGAAQQISELAFYLFILGWPWTSI